MKPPQVTGRPRRNERTRRPRVAADRAPAHLRESSSRQRTGVAFGAGPLAVPISTLDWLLSRESPAARYVALKDLLGRPPKDLELRKARQAVPRDPFVKDVLPQLRNLVAAEAAADWVLLLSEIGCDCEQPEMRHAADVLMARWERTFIEIERGEAPDAGPSFVAVCRALCRIGYSGDPRLVAAADHVARKRIASSDAEATVVRDLAFLASLPVSGRSALLSGAIEFSVGRVVARELGTPECAAERLALTGDARRPDLLETLAALALAGAPRSPAIDEALARLAGRADHRARWKLERLPAFRLPVPLEREGELSRWVTIRALRVVQHYVGLTILGVP